MSGPQSWRRQMGFPQLNPSSFLWTALLALGMLVIGVIAIEAPLCTPIAREYLPTPLIDSGHRHLDLKLE